MASKFCDDSPLDAGRAIGGVAYMDRPRIKTIHLTFPSVISSSIVLLGLVGCCLLAGCGGTGGGNSGGGTQSSSPTITAVSVSCMPASILITQTSTCSPTVTGTGSYSSAVTWTVSPSSMGTISDAGVFMPVAAGPVTITATSKQDATKSGNSSITAANTTALAISIIDLPSGTPGAVTVTDPSGNQTQVTTSQILAATPGNYTIAAAPVVVGNNTYSAVQVAQSVKIASGSPTAAIVDYYDLVSNNTKVLDQAGMQSLTVSADEKTVTINNASAIASSLQAGNVLASAPAPAAPSGLLVNIIGATIQGSTVVLTVSPATLEQAITRGRFTYSQSIAAADSSSLKRVQSGKFLTVRQAREAGIKYASDALPNSCSNDPSAFIEPLNFTIRADGTVTNGDIGSSASGEVQLSGTIELCPQVQMDVKWDALSLQSASVSASFGEHALLTLAGQLSTSVNVEKDLPPLQTPPLITVVGGVPIVVQGQATPYVGAAVSASAAFYASAEQDSQAQAGLAFANGVTTPINSATLQTALDGTSADGSIDGKLYGGVKLGVLLYGSISPNFATDVYVDGSDNPAEQLSLGLECNVGLDLSIFDTQAVVSLTSPELQLFQKTLWEENGSFAPSLSSTQPDSAAGGSGALQIALVGSNFVPDSVMEFNGIALATTFNGPGNITATVPAGLIAVPGTFPITVSNPDTQGATSNPISFIVVPPPEIVTVAPAVAQIPVDALQQFSVTVTNTTNPAVTWSVNGTTGGSAILGTISAAGLYTAPGAVPTPATVTVTATSQADITKSASATVTIGPYTSKTLYSFSSIGDGAAPSAPLIQGTDGSLYGTAQVGGSSGDGTVFKVDSAGDITTLHEFSGTDGSGINGGLVQASDGNFYGTTDLGGAYGEGTVYRIDSSGNFTSLYSFTGGTDGGDVPSSLIQAKDGYLYGTTFKGGASGSGTVFRIDLSGNLMTLYSFTGGTDGDGPEAVIQGSDGLFYGGTQNGGDSSCAAGPGTGCGTIFKIDSTGNLTTLHTFTGGQDGAEIDEPLMQASDGYFYGATIFGGDANCTVSTYTGCGTIFRIDSSGNFTPLHSFSGGAEGGVPFSSLIQAGDGDFYGTAAAGGDASCSVTASGENFPTYIGCGTVFKMDAAGNVNALYSFQGSPNDGSNPFAAVVEGTDGYLYGTTRWGGTATSCSYTSNGGCGTFFRVAGPGGPLPLLSALKPSVALPLQKVVQSPAKSDTRAAAPKMPAKAGQQETAPLSGLKRRN